MTSTHGAAAPSWIFRVTAVAALALVSAAVLVSCTRNRPQAAAAQVRGPRFALDLVPGPSYTHASAVIVFKMHFPPQIACWIESPDGRYLDTIYVTGKSAKKKFFAAPSAGRPEALPVWSHAAAGNAASVDAVSGATPGGGTHHESPAPQGLEPGRSIVKLEVNSSFDYNDHFTKANSGVNGQPSIIYQTDLLIGAGNFTGVFVPIGTGSVDGSDGKIRPGLEGITTALQILGSAQIEYKGD